MRGIATWRRGVLGSLTIAAALIGPSALRAQMATAERLQAPGWWPTKGTAARDEFVGPFRCAPCHASQAATQPTTSMARTARRAEDSDVLREGDLMRFRLARFVYEIDRRGPQKTYTVTDGTRSLSAPLSWAFGAGKVGQTYFFERDGALYEARASYFDSLQGLHLTPKHGLAEPRDLEEALARPVPEAEARRCFGCHTTAPTTRSGFDRAGLIPGVTCEACHGPGRAHVAAMEQGRFDDGRAVVLNPRRFSAADSVDFCGACHATFWDVKLAGERGIAALRSQPHRLQSSRCWKAADARITCVACHEPHRPLVGESASYDAKCLVCHGAAPSRAAANPHPAATVGCTSCHMPTYEVPEMHFRFTDHLIRVAERAPSRP